jgi:hypothetical protein
MYGLGVGEAVGRRGAAVNDFPALGISDTSSSSCANRRETTHFRQVAVQAVFEAWIVQQNPKSIDYQHNTHNTTPTPVKIKLVYRQIVRRQFEATICEKKACSVNCCRQLLAAICHRISLNCWQQFATETL